MVKKKLLKISLAVVFGFAFLALVESQSQDSTTIEIKDDKPASGEVRDGSVGSGFILFSVGVN